MTTESTQPRVAAAPAGSAQPCAGAALSILAPGSPAAAQARQLLDLMPLAIYVCDAAGRIVYHNSRAAELWGRAPDSGDSRYLYCGSERLFTPEGEYVPRDCIPMARGVRFGERFRDHEVQIERADGSRGWCSVNIDPLLDEDRNVVGAINVFLDITERKRAEAAGRVSERRYAELLNALGVAVYTTDADGRITMFNDAAASLWGRRPDIGVDRWCGSLRLYHTDGAPLAHEDCPMGIALRERRPVHQREAVLERPDGTRVPFVAYPTPFVDDEGNLTGAVNVMVDVRRRHEVMDALRRSEAQLLETIAAKDEAIASHQRVEAQLTSLVEASSALIATPQLAETVPAILEIAGRLLTADAYALWTYAEERTQWEILSSSGLSERYLRRSTTRPRTATRRLMEAMVVEDVAADERMVDYLDRYAEEGIRSLFVIPLTVHGENTGTLTFYYRQRHQFTDLEVRVGAALANLASAGMNAARLFDEGARARADLERANERLQLLAHDLAAALREAEEQRAAAIAISTAGSQLATELDMQPLLQSITDIATRLTGAQYGALFYNANDGDERFQLYALSGAPRDAFAKFPAPVDSALFGPTFRGEPVVRVHDVLALDRERSSAANGGIPAALPLRSYLAAPITGHEGDVIGGLFLGHPDPGVFNERAETILAGITRWAAIAIDNAALYRDVRETADRLERANAAKDEFLSLVSHELRTPITVILGNAHVLTNKQRAVDEEMRRGALEDISSEAERLNRIIENLLVLARIERGRGIEPEALLISRVVQSLAERMRNQFRGHEIRVEIAHDGMLVLSNEFCVEQVITNLVSNAAKFSPPGSSIVIGVMRDGDEAMVSVTDSGPGISPDEADRIFAPFYRSRNTAHVSGVGIGLAVCRRLVEAQGGRIWAAPSDPAGATFAFTIPLAPAAPA